MVFRKRVEKIMDNDLLEKIKQVCRINTAQNILTISIEELAELTQVICKLKRLTNQDKTLRKEEHQIFEDLKEELSDVYLLLEQIKILGKINDYEIERRISEKIRRTFEKVGVSN